MDKRRKTNRCKGKTKQGKPCRAAATPGGLCFFHANPKKAAELGRIGGRQNGRRPADLDPLPDLDSAEGVCEANKRVIADVHVGKLPPRTAAVLTQLLNLQLRVIEKTVIEQQLAEVRQELARLRAELEKVEAERARTTRMKEVLGFADVPQAIEQSGSDDGLIGKS